MERLEIIETLKHLPDSIEEEIAGQPDSVLRRRPPAEDWSIAEVVGHLNDHAEIWLKRLRMVCTMTDPQLPGYDGDALVRERGYQDANIRTLLKQLRDTRLETIDLLDHAVDWTRCGNFPGSGRRSLKQLTELALDHEAAHIAQIRAVRELAASRPS